jgi:peptidoglycan DL-endopeptidase CwlO
MPQGTELSGTSLWNVADVKDFKQAIDSLPPSILAMGGAFTRMADTANKAIKSVRDNLKGLQSDLGASGLGGRGSSSNGQSGWGGSGYSSWGRSYGGSTLDAVDALTGRATLGSMANAPGGPPTGGMTGYGWSNSRLAVGAGVLAAGVTARAAQPLVQQGITQSQLDWALKTSTGGQLGSKWAMNLPNWSWSSSNSQNLADLNQGLQGLGVAGYGPGTRRWQSMAGQAGALASIGQNLGLGTTFSQAAQMEQFSNGNGGYYGRMRAGINPSSTNIFANAQTLARQALQGKAYNASNIASTFTGSTGANARLSALTGGDQQTMQILKTYLEAQARNPSASLANSNNLTPQQIAQITGSLTGSTITGKLQKGQQNEAQATAGMATSAATSYADIRLTATGVEKVVANTAGIKQILEGIAAIGGASMVGGKLLGGGGGLIGAGGRARRAYGKIKEWSGIGREAEGLGSATVGGTEAVSTVTAASTVGAETAATVGFGAAAASAGLIAAPIAIGVAAPLAAVKAAQWMQGKSGMNRSHADDQIRAANMYFMRGTATPAAMQILQLSGGKQNGLSASEAAAILAVKGPLSTNKGGFGILGPSSDPVTTASVSNFKLPQSFGPVGSQGSTGNAGGSVGMPTTALGGASGGIMGIAQKYLGVPYLWGGTDPSKGLDCSGFTQLVYRQAGINLPRLSWDQAKTGTAIPGLAQARPGDLLFFAGADGTPSRPGHVGIYMGGGKMIDAPHTGASVRVETAGNPVAIRREMPGLGGGTSTSVGSAGIVGSSVGSSGFSNMLSGLGEGNAGVNEAGTIASSLFASFGSPSVAGAGTSANGGVQGNTAGNGVANAAGSSSTPSSANAALGQKMAASMGWTGSQWTALNNVAMRESGWSMTARNKSSGAFGIAQGINGPAWYAQHGGNATSASGQITGFLNYIQGRYGTPQKAWAHELSVGWYEGGSQYIDRDQMAMLHRGEMVIRAGDASARRMLQGSTRSAPLINVEKGAVVFQVGTTPGSGGTPGSTSSLPSQQQMEESAEHFWAHLQKKAALARVAGD